MDEQEQTTINAQDMGFDEEDLKAAGVELPKDEPQETPEKRPEAAEGNAPDQGENEPKEESTEPEEKPEQDETPHGDLNAALAQERSRRKEMALEVDRLKKEIAQMKEAAHPQAPELPPQTKQEIRTYAQKEAAKRLNLENTDDLMFTHPEKYDEYLRMQGAIEAAETSKKEESIATYNANVRFVNELKATPNFNAIYAHTADMLGEMKYKDTMEFNQAYNRIDNGVGTEKDFKVIRDFMEKVQADMAKDSAPAEAPKAAPAENPLAQAASLPKAGALTNANPVAPKVSNEDILKAIREGREADLPPEIREAIDAVTG